MTTLKAYTDIEQSRKLAEILPLESADMSYQHFVPDLLPEGYCVSLDKAEYETDIPCWSIAALLDILECDALFKTPQGWACQTYIVSKTETTNYYDNPVDACYELISKLNKLNLL